MSFPIRFMLNKKVLNALATKGEAKFQIEEQEYLICIPADVYNFEIMSIFDNQEDNFLVEEEEEKEDDNSN